MEFAQKDSPQHHPHYGDKWQQNSAWLYTGHRIPEYVAKQHSHHDDDVSHCHVGDQCDGTSKPQWQFKNFALTLMLAIAYASNFGGIATIIGTPPMLLMLVTTSRDMDKSWIFSNGFVVCTDNSIITGSALLGYGQGLVSQSHIGITWRSGLCGGRKTSIGQAW